LSISIYSSVLQDEKTSSSENIEGSKKCHSKLLGNGASGGLNISHTNTPAHSSEASNRCNGADFKLQSKKKTPDSSVHVSTLMLRSLDNNEEASYEIYIETSGPAFKPCKVFGRIKPSGKMYSDPY
jgi:hypothetical protein